MLGTLDPHMRVLGQGKARGRHRLLAQIGGQQLRAARRKRSGEHPVGAAQLPAPQVVVPWQAGQGQRTLARLIPAGAVLERIFLLVERVEVGGSVHPIRTS